MILGPISFLDCFVFCVFLAPQLLLGVGLLETFRVILQCLPFLLLRLPTEFIRERYLVNKEKRSPFVQIASPFEDFVIRCVRFAFANVPPRVGRIFFSKPVAMPFLRFRMLRHGYLKSPVHWHEYSDRNFQGLWVIKDPLKKPDVCVYYLHGGGFSMGSCYFYLEFLISWVSLLSDAGYQNPAVFALEYTLVPDSCFPTQLQQAIAAYQHVLSTVGKQARVCVAGDSAGATIALSLLLHLARLDHDQDKMDRRGAWQLAKPQMATFISPWVTLVSPTHQNTVSDYLESSHLHLYAEQYAGPEVATDDPLVSPGNCREVGWWRKACPSEGIFFAYGAEEVFAPDIDSLVEFMRENKMKVEQRKEPGGIHAWPVASLFLSGSIEERLKGLKSLVEEIKVGIDPNRK